MTAETPIHTQGEQLGAYQLERLLGRGAAAEVWQAVETGDMGFRKRQALKLLRPPPGEMEAQKKALITEARVCGHLKHPGVVDVYRVGEHSGEIYVAMEFVDGPDLNTLLEGLRRAEVPIPVPVCVEMAIEICDALDHAHTARDDDGSSLEIIHRDLKPSNILVDRRGVLKISDWGLVKSSINLESTTRGVVKGTPGYIAPEVWGGTRDFQPSVDLFAVGAMLFEFVVGERLFQGRNLARIAERVARRKPEEEAGRLEERAPQLVPVVARLLERVPAHRYQTADEVASILREIHGGMVSRITLKDFLRDVSSIVEQLSPAVTGTGRVGADPEMTVDTPIPATPPLASTASVRRLVDQNAPTHADEAGPAEDEEMHTDPGLSPIRGAPAEKPSFPAPRTVAFTADPSVSAAGRGAQIASAFRPEGPVGTEGVATAVPQTRAMAPIVLPGAEPAVSPNVAATRVQGPELPEEARDTIPPEAGVPAPGAGKKRRRKRAFDADGNAIPRKRRRSPDVAPPPPPKTSRLAWVAVLFGVTLLVIGIVVAASR